jgi:hypothetical protein
MLPPELWAKNEDYLWYCVGKNEPTLQLRYMRGAGGDRPFTVCHYENVKIRTSMAELAANGGAPMTRYANFNDPESRRELTRFFRFLKQHDDAYHASVMAGEAVLLYPRSQLQQGRFTDAMSAFHSVGERLLTDHILFDVLPDDMATPDKLARYRRIFTTSSIPELDRESYAGLSRFEAPPSVRVSASNPEKGGVWDIHFVNAPEFLVYGVARVYLGSGTSTAGPGSNVTPSSPGPLEATRVTPATKPHTVTHLAEDCDRTSDGHAH